MNRTGRCRALRGVAIVWFLLVGAFPSASGFGAPEAFAQTVPAIADNFNAASGAPLQGRVPTGGSISNAWLVAATGSGSPGTAVLVGGRAKVGADATATWVTTLVGSVANGIVGVDYHVGLTGLSWGGVIARATDADNYLLGLATADNLYLFRRQAGTWTTLTSAMGVAPAAPGSVHRLEVRAIDSTIEVWWDGRRHLQATVTFQQTANRSGVAWAPGTGPATTYDNFSVTLPLVYDTFSGPDETPLTNHVPGVAASGLSWQVSATGSGTPGNPHLQGGEAAASTNATAIWVAGTVEGGTSDAIVGADYQVGPTGVPWGGVIARATDGNNYLLGLAASDNLYLFRMEGGEWTMLAVATGMISVAPGSVHRLEMHAIDSAVELWWDGTRYLRVRETFQQTATRHGVAWVPSYDPGTRYDNFLVLRSDVYDAFTAADGTALTSHVADVSQAGQAWEVSATGSGTAGTPIVQSGEAGAGTGATATWVGSTVDAGASDAILGVDYHVGATGSPWGGVIARATDGNNYLLGLAASDSLYVFRMQGGTWTQLKSKGNIPMAPGSLHRLEVHAIGDTIELWWDGTRHLQVVEETFQQTATRHGVAWSPGSSPGSRYDNFSVQRISGVVCDPRIWLESTTIPASGGSGTVSVVNGAGCPWAATSDATWLQVPPGASGAGHGGFGYSAAATTATTPRTATLMIAGPSTSTSISISQLANTPPVVTLTAPANGTTFTALANIPVVATASDTDGSIARVEFFANGTLIGFPTAPPYAITYTGVGPGTYVITAKAFDNDGNSTVSAARTVTVTAPPPTVTLTSPANGGSYQAPASIAIAGTATSVAGTITRLEVFANGILIGTPRGAPFSFTYSGVSAGTYAIHAVAHDSNGNSAVSSTTTVSVTPCNYTVALSTPTSLPAEGGTGTATVTTMPGCTWQAFSNADWIGVSGVDLVTASITYSVLANPGGPARTGSFDVAFHTINLWQAGSDPIDPPPPPPSCTVTVSQASSVTFVGAGVWRTDVIAPAGCTWTAAADVAWMSVSPTSGTGSAPLTYVVPINNGAARSGHLNVNGLSIDVRQAGEDGAYDVYFPPPLAPWCIIFQVPECQSAECGMATVCIPDFEAPRVPQFLGPPPLQVTGPNVVWWFDGAQPPGYSTRITLQSTGGSQTQWQVVNGADKVVLSGTTGATTQVSSTGTAFSQNAGDIRIRATSGQQTFDFNLTTRTPYRLDPGTVTHQCHATLGYEVFIRYTVLDQLGTALPNGVSANEQWNTPWIADYFGTDWRESTAGGITVSTATFADNIQGELATMTPQPTCNPNSTTPVRPVGQEWRIGSVTLGVGRHVQN